VGRSLESLSPADPAEALARRKSTGTPGNLRLDVPRAALAGQQEWLEREEAAKRARITSLAGAEVELFRDPLAGSP